MTAHQPSGNVVTMIALKASTENRFHPRIQLNKPARVRLPDGQEATGCVHDISRIGFQLRCDRALAASIHTDQSAINADSFMTLEEVSDSLQGGDHNSSNLGSSAKTPMFKFFAKMSGMRVEFIIHTNESYLNYMYQKDVAHDEYEVKRIFDSGVAELLFPWEIYHLDMKQVKEKLIRGFRSRIEEF